MSSRLGFVILYIPPLFMSSLNIPRLMSVRVSTICCQRKTICSKEVPTHGDEDNGDLNDDEEQCLWYFKVLLSTSLKITWSLPVCWNYTLVAAEQMAVVIVSSFHADGDQVRCPASSVCDVVVFTSMSGCEGEHGSLGFQVVAQFLLSDTDTCGKIPSA